VNGTNPRRNSPELLVLPVLAGVVAWIVGAAARSADRPLTQEAAARSLECLQKVIPNCGELTYPWWQDHAALFGLIVAATTFVVIALCKAARR